MALITKNNNLYTISNKNVSSYTYKAVQSNFLWMGIIVKLKVASYAGKLSHLLFFPKKKKKLKVT